MKKHGKYFELSASDLVGYLNCQHLSELDRAVAEGVREKPKVWDPLLEVLWERGAVHEQNYVQHLKDAGFEVLRIDGVDVSQDAVSQTLEAMKSGTPVIVQGALAHGGWIGRADILRRVETPSALGNWSYEAIDMEPFYDFTRETDLQDANKALRRFEAALELEDVPSISEETKGVVRAHNQDDCASASALRDWLETLRAQLIAGGTEVPRPERGDATPSAVKT